MSKKDKLVQNILNNPKNVSFENLKKVLENDGYIGINKGGSHWVFRKNDYESITIPYKRPIKIIYVKKVLSMIGELSSYP